MELGGKACAIGQAPRPPESPFYADRTVMCPDNGAVDYVGASVPLDQFGQRFEHRLEYASSTHRR